MAKAILVTFMVIVASIISASLISKYVRAAEMAPAAVHVREVEFVLVVVNNRIGLVTMQDFSTRRTCMFAKEHVENSTAHATLSTTKADCLTR